MAFDLRHPPILPLTALLWGCNEYELGKDLGVGSPETETADTATTPNTQTEETETTDTATTTNPSTTPYGCYAPTFGYDSSPAARLVVTDDAAPIVVTLVLSDTAYDDSLTLDAPESRPLMDAWAVAVGAAVTIGPYPVSTELVFGIDVWNTGDHWQSGPSSRNADGVAHVAVTYEGDCSWLIGFEDLYGGGDLDYNDVVFRVEGLLVAQ